MGEDLSNPAIRKFVEDSRFIYEAWKEADINGFQTNILDCGAGQILFQTPIAKYLEPFWTPILRHFEKTRRIITYERRESTSQYMHAWDRAKDMLAVMDHLEITRCDIVSHSSGAVASFHFALMYPERVRSIVLMNVAAFYPKLRGPIAVLSDKLAPLLPDAIVLPLFLTFLAKRGTEDYALHRYAFGKFKPLGLHLKYSLNHITQEHDLRESLCAIRCPVLLINRTDDAVVPMEDMVYLHDRLPRCFGLHTVAGGGHMFHYRHAGDIIGFMEGFYRRISKEN